MDAGLLNAGAQVAEMPQPTVSSITPLSGKGLISLPNDVCMDAGLLNAGAQVAEMPQPTVSSTPPQRKNEENGNLTLPLQSVDAM